MSLNYKVIGKHIREVRQRNHLSQAMLSELVDKTPSYISYIVTVKGCRVITNKVRHGNFINPVMQQQRNNRMPEFTSCRSKRKP